MFDIILSKFNIENLHISTKFQVVQAKTTKIQESVKKLFKFFIKQAMFNYRPAALYGMALTMILEDDPDFLLTS